MEIFDAPNERIFILNDEEFKELGEILPLLPRPNTITEYLQARYDDWKKDHMDEADEDLYQDVCEHDNYDTTYEDEYLWQGYCLDCGADLEDERDTSLGVQ